MKDEQEVGLDSWNCENCKDFQRTGK